MLATSSRVKISDQYRLTSGMRAQVEAGWYSVETAPRSQVSHSSANRNSATSASLSNGRNVWEHVPSVETAEPGDSSEMTYSEKGAVCESFLANLKASRRTWTSAGLPASK